MPKQKPPHTRIVPCNGCTLCCEKDLVRLEPEDRAGDYQTEPHPYLRGALMLAHKPNGDCIYLNAHGCTIHNHAPALCRIADCRALALQMDFDQAMTLHRMGKLDIRVWNQGQKLVEEEREAAKKKH